MSQSLTRQATRNVSKSHDNFIDSLLSGQAWSQKSLQYAFPAKASAYDYPGEKTHAFAPVGTWVKNAVTSILDRSHGNSADDGFSIEGFTNLKISLGNPGSAAIRYAESSFNSGGGVNQTAYAYYPSSSSRGGDVWFGRVIDYNLAREGNFYFAAIMHETGHAFGLKHAHVAEGRFPAIRANHDSLEYTVMTYHTYVGDSGSAYTAEAAGFPQSFMMADIAALQHMYGANYTVNSGRTVYSWAPGNGKTMVNGHAAITPEANRIFATIWDGGGNDTYDLHRYKTDLAIDLRPGQSSIFSHAQLADLNGGPNGGYARGNIFNALMADNNKASLIEHAKGGQGDDVLNGNQTRNHLSGGGGDDVLAGFKGNDKCTGGAGSDTFIFKSGWDHDVVTDFQPGTDQVNLSAFGFDSFSEVLALAEQRGSDVFLFFGHGDYLKLANSDLGQLQGGDFIL